MQNQLLNYTDASYYFIHIRQNLVGGYFEFNQFSYHICNWLTIRSKKEMRKQFLASNLKKKLITDVCLIPNV